jgi:hypothetical protein
MGLLIRTRKVTLVLIVLTWAVGSAAPSAHAHFGGFIVQIQNGSLIVGQDSETTGGQPNWDTRAVGSLFAPEYYSDLPSFLSLASAPAGTQALPTNTNIYWDFLPMTVGGYTSNLLYWDGQGTNIADVDFGPVPVPAAATDVTMGIYNTTDNASALVSDTPDMLPGALLGVTNSGGSGLRLHRHNYFLLDDGDGIAPTNVEEGVYLIALQLRMPGYGPSRPIFVVPGTYELINGSLPSLQAAVDWVNQNASSLILDGDYAFDGAVDLADHTAWTRQFGTIGPYPLAGDGDYADGNRDGKVDAADYVYWRKLLAAGSGGGALAGSGTSVPEPVSSVIIVWAAAIATLYQRKRVGALSRL